MHVVLKKLLKHRINTERSHTPECDLVRETQLNNLEEREKKEEVFT